MDDNINNKESAISSLFNDNLYKETLPVFIENYWLTKKFSHIPNKTAINKDGSFNKKAIKRIEAIMKNSNWMDMVAKYNSRKSQTGYGATVIHLVSDRKGNAIPRIEVVEGVVRYNQFLGEDAGIEVIEKLTRGTFPILRITRYGKISDTFWYEATQSVSEIEDDKEREDIENLLKITKKITHNYGFIRAKIFRNRSGTYDAFTDSWSFGRGDLDGWEKKIKNLDLTLNRLNTMIDQEAGHLEVNIASGNVIGGGISQQQKDILGKKIEDKSGTVKINYRTIETNDGIDSTYIPGDLDPAPLRAELREKLRELYLDLGIQSSYDSDGKTNDTNAKVDKVGDQAFKEATLRIQQEVEFWSDQFEMIMNIDILTGGAEHWTNVMEINIKPRMNDFRIKIEMMDKIDKLIKILPINKIFEEMFDISSGEAIELADMKEEEVKNKVVSFLGVANGNLPQNIEVPFEWGTIKEPDEKTDEETSSEEDDNKEEVENEE